MSSNSGELGLLRTIRGAVNENGVLNVGVNSASQRTAFGEIATAPFKPECGWLFPYNINSRAILSVTGNSGTVTHSGNFAILSTTTNTAGSAQIITKELCSYVPGIGAKARFTAIFTLGVPDSEQFIGLGTLIDGWFFGYSGAVFGIARYKSGVQVEWIPQTSWNVNTYATLDPTKGNVYEIKYQYLGFGMQYFGVEQPNGNMEIVHKIEYTNTYTDVSVDNPMLPLLARVKNAGNTSNVVLKTPSAVAGIEGYPSEILNITNGYSYMALAVTATSCLFTIKNPDTYQSVENRLNAKLKLLNVAIESNKPATLLAYLNGALNASGFTNIETNTTPLQVDTTATAVTGGSLLLAIPLAKADSKLISTADIAIKLHKGDTLTFLLDTGAATDVRVGLSFNTRI